MIGQPNQKIKYAKKLEFCSQVSRTFFSFKYSSLVCLMVQNTVKGAKTKISFPSTHSLSPPRVKNTHCLHSEHRFSPNMIRIMAEDFLTASKFQMKKDMSNWFIVLALPSPIDMNLLSTNQIVIVKPYPSTNIFLIHGYCHSRHKFLWKMNESVCNIFLSTQKVLGRSCMSMEMDSPYFPLHLKTQSLKKRSSLWFCANDRI